MSEPTPRPWLEFCESGDWWIARKDEPTDAIVCGANEMSTADMLLIVRAVNCHDELVAALDRLMDSQRGLNLAEWPQSFSDYVDAY